MRVVFMGTPDIAATCLKKILADGFSVVGVYTQPDRPKNRGMKLAFSPVKEVALAHDLPVFQPENFREDETVEQLRQQMSDPDAQAALLATKDGLAPIAYGVTGARALRTACNLGVALHIIGGVLGMGVVLTLVLLGAMHLLTPVNMFLYQLVWAIPGLLVTEWTRSV